MIIEQIRMDMAQARKDRDSAKSSSLSYLLSEIEKVGKNNGNRISTEEEAISVIKKIVAGLTESENLIKEKDISHHSLSPMRRDIFLYKKYLPIQMSEEQIIEAIRTFKARNGEGSNIGQIMKYLKENFAGQYDGSMASRIAKKEIETKGNFIDV